jgi:hypothetical protein
MRFKGKIISTCREINNKLFLVSPLGVAHVLFDDHVFLIIGMVNITRMLTTMRVHC